MSNNQQKFEVAVVEFLNGSKPYHYYTDTVCVHAGDYVVVQGVVTASDSATLKYGTGKVIAIEYSLDKPNKSVVLKIPTHHVATQDRYTEQEAKDRLVEMLS